MIGPGDHPQLSKTDELASAEFGHGLGFPDYYNWEAWVSGTARPPSIMVAGAAALVTEWDMWMLRHTYSSLKSRL